MLHQIVQTNEGERVSQRRILPLLAYLRTMSKEERAAFAARCQRSPGSIRNVASGYRKAGVALALLIEEQSHGAVLKTDVLPDFPWPKKDAAEH